jgi:hypothetical protein
MYEYDALNPNPGQNKSHMPQKSNLESQITFLFVCFFAKAMHIYFVLFISLF